MKFKRYFTICIITLLTWQSFGFNEVSKVFGDIDISYYVSIDFEEESYELVRASISLSDGVFSSGTFIDFSINNLFFNIKQDSFKLVSGETPNIEFLNENSYRWTLENSNVRQTLEFYLELDTATFEEYNFNNENKVSIFSKNIEITDGDKIHEVNKPLKNIKTITYKNHESSQEKSYNCIEGFSQILKTPEELDFIAPNSELEFSKWLKNGSSFRKFLSGKRIKSFQGGYYVASWQEKGMSRIDDLVVGDPYFTKTVEGPDSEGKYKINLNVKGENWTYNRDTNEIVLVLDSSGSIERQNKNGNLMEASIKFAEKLLEGNGKYFNRLAIVRFSTDLVASYPFSNKINLLRDNISNHIESVNASSNLQIGIEEARKLLIKGKSNNKHLIITSDGVSNRSLGLKRSSNGFWDLEDFEPIPEDLRLYGYETDFDFWVKSDLEENKLDKNIILEDVPFQYNSGDITDNRAKIIGEDGIERKVSVDPDIMSRNSLRYAVNEGAKATLIGFGFDTLTNPANERYRLPLVAKDLAEYKEIENNNIVAEFSDMAEAFLSLKDVNINDEVKEGFEIIGNPEGDRLFSIQSKNGQEVIYWEIGDLDSEEVNLTYYIKPKSSLKLNNVTTQVGIPVGDTSVTHGSGGRVFDSTSIPMHIITYKTEEKEFKVGYPINSNVSLLSFGETSLPSKEGYVFDGWESSKEGQFKITEDMVVKAKWSKISENPNTSNKSKNNNSYMPYAPNEPKKDEVKKSNSSFSEIRIEKIELGKVIFNSTKILSGTPWSEISKRILVIPKEGYRLIGFETKDGVRLKEGFIFSKNEVIKPIFEKVTEVTKEKDSNYLEYNPNEFEDILESDVSVAASGLLNYNDFLAYIQGYEDGSVRPENYITREEVAAIFFRLLDKEYRELIRSEDNAFSDVGRVNWSNKHISTLANGGIINGYADGTFKPQNYITRGELTAVISKFDVLNRKSKHEFKDIKGHWAEGYIANAYQKHWINGYPNGSFMPNNYITRAELSKLINNVLERSVNPENILPNVLKFNDLEKERWYYSDIVTATNSYLSDSRDNKYQIWDSLIFPDIEM